MSHMNEYQRISTPCYGVSGIRFPSLLCFRNLKNLHCSRYSSGKGWLLDRFGSTKVIIVTGILNGLLIFALKEATLGMGLWVVLWIMGVNQAIRFPVTEVFIMHQSPAKHRSTIYGIYYSTMQYTGAIFAPILGIFIDNYGFNAIFTFSAVAVTIIALVTALFIWDAKDFQH